MEFPNDSPTVLILAAALIALFVLGLVTLIAGRRRRTRQLSERYGTEYDRTVKELGSRGRAEKDLIGRGHRVEHYRSVPCPMPSAAASPSRGAGRCSGSWTARWPPYRRPTSS